MRSEIRWRYPADNAALKTDAGERIGNVLRIRGKSDRALSGPGLALPAGTCRVRVNLARPGSGSIRIELTADEGRRTLASEKIEFLLRRSTVIELGADLPEETAGLEVRISCRREVSLDIESVEIDLDRELPDEPLRPDRAVGTETSKTYADKIESGFFARYLSGPVVMEVGYKGYDGGTVPIVPQAIGVDVDYPGYDGETFPFADKSFDAIYSSHCFEHIRPWKAVLRDWYRLLKIGGFLVIVVPHQLLFERKRHLPSYFNPDHKRYYTARSLLGEIEEALEENSYRIRHLIENDKNFDYTPSPREGSSGCYEIELVIEKIAVPYWHPDDGSVRAYPSGEFRSTNVRVGLWATEIDLSQCNHCQIFGPYAALAPAYYVAEYHFEPMDIPPEAPITNMVFDIARDGVRTTVRDLDREQVREMLREGRFALPFSSDRHGSVYEFRVFAGRFAVDLKPRFLGVDVRYARLPRDQGIT